MLNNNGSIPLCYFVVDIPSAARNLMTKFHLGEREGIRIRLTMSLSWKQAIKDFETYLRLEKSLSENSIEAYTDDVLKLERYFL